MTVIGKNLGMGELTSKERAVAKGVIFYQRTVYAKLENDIHTD